MLENVLLISFGLLALFLLCSLNKVWKQLFMLCALIGMVATIWGKPVPFLGAGKVETFYVEDKNAYLMLSNPVRVVVIPATKETVQKLFDSFKVGPSGEPLPGTGNLRYDFYEAEHQLYEKPPKELESK